MKYFFIAGERSGDLHASNLIKELKKLDFESQIVGFGGDMMESAGMKLLRHYKDYSFMGIWEVIKNLGTISKRLSECESHIREQKPDVLVLVDFPGFNLRMAAFAKSFGIKTCYYISPKIWAWKKGRIKKIRKYVDKMLCILPFEVAFYKTLNYEVDYVGNPLMDAIRAHDYQPIDTQNKTCIAVLPGSRVQELKSALPVIEDMARSRPEFEFWIAGVDNLPGSMYQPLQKYANVTVYFDRTYDMLKSANASVVTSGTATLEAGLLSAPQVVIYRTSWLTEKIGRLVINVDYLSLVNLIAEKEAVKELIQQEFNAETVLKEVDAILNDPVYCSRILSDYMDIKEKIGYEPASKRAAQALTSWIMPPEVA